MYVPSLGWPLARLDVGSRKVSDKKPCLPRAANPTTSIRAGQGGWRLPPLPHAKRVSANQKKRTRGALANRHEPLCSAFSAPFGFPRNWREAPIQSRARVNVPFAPFTFLCFAGARRDGPPWKPSGADARSQGVGARSSGRGGGVFSPPRPPSLFPG